MGEPVVHVKVVGSDGPLRAFCSELFGWELQTDQRAPHGLETHERRVSPMRR
jgi:hypothetical protein